MKDAYPMLTEVSDQAAISDVNRGNREMFEVLVRRYNQRLYRVGIAYLHGHAAVEDAMQNAFLKAFLHLGQFSGTSSFSTWLTRIMINECLETIRRNKSLEGLKERSVDASDDALEENRATRNLSLKDMKAVLEQATREIPEKYRTVYILREVEQLSTEQTAELLQMSEANVKVALHRARQMIKTRLLANVAADELFPYPAKYCNGMTARVMKAILEA
ncbi:MAG TPA: sigma-70 family RNA polymerase sigma factor [Opitutaceae bacterium]